MNTFIYRIFIDTNAKKLWDALTMPEWTRRYWDGFSIRSEWRVGSDVTLMKPDGTLNWKGEILASNRSERLSYTFDPSVDGNYVGETVSKVSWKFERLHNLLLLTLTHEALSDTMAGHVAIGWPLIVSRLKTALEAPSI